MTDFTAPEKTLKPIKGNDLSNLNIKRDMHTHPFEKGKTLEAMEAFVLRAMELEFAEIVFSEHAPAEESLGIIHATPLNEIDLYYRYTRILQEKYEGIIRIIFGIEADYHPLNVSMIEKLKKLYPFEYFIGAVHLHVSPWQKDITGLSAAELIDFSFKQTLDLASSGLFDALAHFDRFREVFFKLNLDFNPVRLKDYYMQLFKTAKAGEIILEINTSKCSTPVGGTLESIAEIMLWSKDIGIEYVFGSDAHHTEKIGAWFSDLDNSIKKTNALS